MYDVDIPTSRKYIVNSCKLSKNLSSKHVVSGLLWNLIFIALNMYVRKYVEFFTTCSDLIVQNRTASRLVVVVMPFVWFLYINIHDCFCLF